MRKLFLFFLLALVAVAGQALAQPFGAPQTLLNPTPAGDDNFGYAVAGAGNKALVGAPQDDTRGSNTGAAYLFNASTGELLQEFFNPDPVEDDQFGYAVAMVGDKVLIGAPLKDTGTLVDAGAAYLFDGTTGALLQTIMDPSPDNDELFGIALATLGNNFLVGAPFDDSGATDAGAAYLFDGSSGAWIRTFANPTPAAGDEFGIALAGAGSNVLVGAPSDDALASNSGAAHVFDGTTGSPIFTLTNPTPAATDLFGKAVGASGSNLIVAAPSDDAGAGNAGVVYVYSGAGALLQTFSNPASAIGDAFGTSVSGVGSSGLILVGTPMDDSPLSNSGTAYLFNGTAGGGPVQTIGNPAAANGDQFSFSVAGIGNNILLGTPFDDASGTDAGIAYYYASPNAPPLANAGADQTLECTSPAGMTVTLDGSASSDPDNNPLTYTWREGVDILDGPTIIPTSEENFHLGTHTIELTVDDGNGGTDTDVVLIIVQDTTPPTISLNGANPITLECNAPYNEPGAVVSDACDPSPGLVITGTVNPNVSGTYTITYTATDARGNSASKTRTVNVVADITPPTITLNGANPMTLECNAPYNEPGAVVSDGCDPSPGLVITGTVNPNVSGTYTITYTATDARGNSASKTRTVNVVADITPPTITLNGANPMTLECHAGSYVEPGAVVSDGCDPAPSLVISGSVNSNLTGAYTITYTATDARGNHASATRTVNVVDTTPPTITVKPPVVFESNSHYYTTITQSMSIASVTDGCAGSISIYQAVITKVTSDEPEDTWGSCDGYTDDDIVILSDCKSVKVRKEHKCNGNGRVYTIHWKVSDPSGNVGTAVSKVEMRICDNVPAVDNGPVYTVNSNCCGLGKSDFTEAPGSDEESAATELPEGYAVFQNYPNPFNPTTEIGFELPVAGHVVVTIFNTLGELIYTAANREFPAGAHVVSWNATNRQGERVPSGVYFYRVSTSDFTVTKRMILAK